MAHVASNAFLIVTIVSVVDARHISWVITTCKIAGILAINAQVVIAKLAHVCSHMCMSSKNHEENGYGHDMDLFALIACLKFQKKWLQLTKLSI
jgi:hypothetical protein